MSWPCFLLIPTSTALATLRRYTFSSERECPNGGSHSAFVDIGEAAFPRTDIAGTGADSWPHDDPRWPSRCSCGYAFGADDQWQYNLDRIFEGGGYRGPLRWNRLPIGAMWDAPWFSDHWRGPDGRCLILRLPDGTDWCIDGPANNGPGWQRSGEPPLITATPSIASGRYHGFLQNGVLTDDLEGRSYAS